MSDFGALPAWCSPSDHVTRLPLPVPPQPGLSHAQHQQCHTRPCSRSCWGCANPPGRPRLSRPAPCTDTPRAAAEAPRCRLRGRCAALHWFGGRVFLGTPRRAVGLISGKRRAPERSVSGPWVCSCSFLTSPSIIPGSPSIPRWPCGGCGGTGVGHPAECRAAILPATALPALPTRPMSSRCSAASVLPRFCCLHVNSH